MLLRLPDVMVDFVTSVAPLCVHLWNDGRMMLQPMQFNVGLTEANISLPVGLAMYSLFTQRRIDAGGLPSPLIYVPTDAMERDTHSNSLLDVDAVKDVMREEERDREDAIIDNSDCEGVLDVCQSVSEDTAHELMEGSCVHASMEDLEMDNVHVLTTEHSHIECDNTCTHHYTNAFIHEI